jgi:hypothetical protein
MTEDHGSLIAASALNIHEIGVGGGDKSFEFVAETFGLECRVKEISVHVCCWL